METSEALKLEQPEPTAAEPVKEEEPEKEAVTGIVVAKDPHALSSNLEFPMPVTTDLVVVARNSSEMAQAQSKLVEWVDSKIAHEKAVLAEAEGKLALAKEQHQRRSAFTGLVKEAKAVVLYYEKVRLALLAGYCIVPNFPIQLIAVRTDDKEPGYMESANSWVKAFDVPVESLPPGEGRYVDPEVRARVETREVVKKQGEPPERKKYAVSSGGFREVAFPARLAKMVIMEDLGRAQQLKLFDSIGMLPASARRVKDPMLIGQIRNKKNIISFMIAWWIDTSAL